VHAASRTTLDQLTESLDGALSGATDTAAAGATTGSELFEVADLLDSDRSLRTALVDQTVPADRRAALADGLLADKVSDTTRETVSQVVKGTWSNTRDLRHGLVELGRRALLRAAHEQGQREKVATELFDLARLLEREPELEMLLADRLASGEKRRELLAKVLYGHVSAITEALALQVVGRPVSRPVEDLDALCDFAAEPGRTSGRPCPFCGALSGHRSRHWVRSWRRSTVPRCPSIPRLTPASSVERSSGSATK
jgi:F-type H+-transporting ATPase subunit delta